MRRTWVWRFDQPSDAIWESLADTARVNEAAAFPKHDIDERPQPDGSVLYLGRLRKGPFTIEWQEKPVNWVSNQWFEHRRLFRNGPFKSICATLELAPDGAGCRGTYRLEVEPANALGVLILRTGFFTRIGATFARLAQDASAFASGSRATPFDYRPPQPSDEARRRLDRAVEDIEATPHGHGLARRLASHVTTAQEVDLWHIRPLKLARDWGVAPRRTVELCLQAVRSGLLELRWDLLCPRCRVAKAWAPSLDQLPRGAHCASCNIDYDRDFSRNVEAAFRPAAAVRPIESGEYCLFGPMNTPHIKLHVTLDPGETRRLRAALPPGPYRLRTLEAGPEQLVDWRAGGFPEVIADGTAVRAGEPAEAGLVALSNQSCRPLTIIVEDRTWIRDALTADRVTALQAFRDLFAGDVLRAGDEVGIREVTLMFTDLKGSTALYERIGEARAYHLVREHFAFLGELVRAREGAIVKTMGDAVMAVFADPAEAVRAALAIQDRVVAFNADQNGAGLVIKLGLHKGPCIAVTLNDRLDYFGTTVNLAARLQGQSLGGDIVLSQGLLDDPAVAALLAAYPLESASAPIKGFARPIPFHRLTPAALATPSNG